MKSEPKFIVVTGGVCSGLGKGLASASLGALLKASGLSVFTQKYDPYLNVDPGTMSPFQHGEVFVTEDGAETDLDLGHYERFIDTNLSKLSSVSSGQVYSKVISRERKGDYLGGTIQVIPHITNEIKQFALKAADESKTDVIIIEIGGTVGDIEGEPFLEAFRQLHSDLGKDRVMFVHLVLLPYLKSSKELKTKPAQASVRALRHIGIQPEIIIARADYKIPDALLTKLSLFCDVDKEAVIPAPTIKSIYKVPLTFADSQFDKLVIDRLRLQVNKERDLTPWEDLAKRIENPKGSVKIGLIGKYNALEDAYISVVESIKSACYTHSYGTEIVWIDAERLEKGDFSELEEIDGLVVPGGFGKRGVEGKILAAKYARENKKPYLGLCLGMQILAIEFARNVCDLEDSNSTEFEEKCKNDIIHLLPSQEQVFEKGGTMRLGAYECSLIKGTKASDAYKEETIFERHRHRYEFNNKYRKNLEDKGLKISGVYKKYDLIEIVEIKDHPFMLGCQFHPEFKSRPLRPHPLFQAFIDSCIKLKEEKDLK